MSAPTPQSTTSDLEAPVMVGHCIRTGRRFRALAHAHTKGTHRGWICVNVQRRLTPNRVLHELAHIITGHRHSDVWRKAFIAIGGTLSAIGDSRDWHKRQRRRGRYAGLYPPHSAKCPCSAQPPHQETR